MKVSKKSPSSARNQTEDPSIRRGERLGTDAPGRKTDLPRHRRGGNPENDERKQDAPAAVTPSGDNHQRRQRKQHAASHAPIGAGDRQIDGMFGPGRSHPFQQMAMRDRHANERAHDCIQHQPGLVRQHRDRHANLRGAE